MRTPDGASTQASSSFTMASMPLQKSNRSFLCTSPLVALVVVVVALVVVMVVVVVVVVVWSEDD